MRQLACASSVGIPVGRHGGFGAQAQRRGHAQRQRVAAIGWHRAPAARSRGAARAPADARPARCSRPARTSAALPGAAGIRAPEVLAVHDEHVGAHLVVDVAAQGHDARAIELHRRIGACRGTAATGTASPARTNRPGGSRCRCSGKPTCEPIGTISTCGTNCGRPGPSRASVGAASGRSGRCCAASPRCRRCPCRPRPRGAARSGAAIAAGAQDRRPVAVECKSHFHSADRASNVQALGFRRSPLNARHAELSQSTSHPADRPGRRRPDRDVLHGAGPYEPRSGSAPTRSWWRVPRSRAADRLPRAPAGQRRSVLAADYGLREAVASGGHGRHVASALGNHAARIGADLTWRSISTGR